MKNQFWLFGAKLNILTDQVINNSGFDLVEGIFPPGAQSPLHIHAKYSETLYVLEGELTVYLPGVEQIVKIGESFYIPANVPHCVVNSSAENSFKALAVAYPGGFAKLIRAVGIIADDNQHQLSQQHDMKLAAQVMVEVGDAILGPPGARP